MSVGMSERQSSFLSTSRVWGIVLSLDHSEKASMEGRDSAFSISFCPPMGTILLSPRLDLSDVSVKRHLLVKNLPPIAFELSCSEPKDTVSTRHWWLSCFKAGGQFSSLLSPLMIC